MPAGGLDLLATSRSAFSRFTREQMRVGAGYIYAIARLKPSLNIRQAQAEMDVQMRQYLQSNAGKIDADPDGRMLVDTLQNSVVDGVRQALLRLCAAVGAGILIACATVASLLLARATGRPKGL